MSSYEQDRRVMRLPSGKYVVSRFWEGDQWLVWFSTKSQQWTTEPDAYYEPEGDYDVHHSTLVEAIAALIGDPQ